MKIFIRCFLLVLICMSFLLSANITKSIDEYVPPEKTTYNGKNVTFWYAYNSSFWNITPNYQIIAIADKNSIERGESFIISFQISGNGKILANKLITYYPRNLLKGNPIYSMYISDIKINASFYRVAWWDEPYTVVGDPEAAFISLVDSTFMKSKPDIEMIFGEEIIDGHRPIEIKAIASDNASAGDHIVKIQFDYTDGGSWYSSQDEVIIHIKDWYEILWVQILIVVLTILVTLGLDILIRWLMKDNTNWSNRKKNQNNPNKKSKKNGKEKTG